MEKGSVFSSCKIFSIPVNESVSTTRKVICTSPLSYVRVGRRSQEKKWRVFITFDEKSYTVFEEDSGMRPMSVSTSGAFEPVVDLMYSMYLKRSKRITSIAPVMETKSISVCEGDYRLLCVSPWFQFDPANYPQRAIVTYLVIHPTSTVRKGEGLYTSTQTWKNDDETMLIGTRFWGMERFLPAFSDFINRHLSISMFDNKNRPRNLLLEAPVTNICPFCGAENEIGGKFCKSCGTTFQP